MYERASVPLGCAVAPMFTVPTALQRFEHGAMINLKGIYMLQEGPASVGGTPIDGGTWSGARNTWREPSRLSLGWSRPTGLFEPILGFGKAWREQFGGPGRTTRLGDRGGDNSRRELAALRARHRRRDASWRRRDPLSRGPGVGRPRAVSVDIVPSHGATDSPRPAPSQPPAARASSPSRAASRTVSQPGHSACSLRGKTREGRSPHDHALARSWSVDSFMRQAKTTSQMLHAKIRRYARSCGVVLAAEKPSDPSTSPCQT